jgi:hypothetical protein
MDERRALVVRGDADRWIGQGTYTIWNHNVEFSLRPVVIQDQFERLSIHWRKIVICQGVTDFPASHFFHEMLRYR